MDIIYQIKILPCRRYPERKEAVFSLLEVDKKTAEQMKGDREFDEKMSKLGKKITRLIEQELGLFY